MTEADLLAVLDMSEDAQRVEIAKRLSIKSFKHDWGFSNAVGGSDNIATGEAWVCRKCGHEEIYKRIKSGQYIPAVLDKQSPECGLPDPITESLADLAFRLRDEVKSKVEFHHCIAKVCKHIDPHIMNYAGYGLCTCKPIHWIIAALIAKGKEND